MAEGLAALEIDVDSGRRQRLIDYLRLLHKWNRAYNLTAVRDPLEMIPRHLLDSLSLLPLLNGERIIDVGSGAGLPGLVLAIADPRRQFVLLDSALKRTRFLTQAVHELQLANVRVERARVEELSADRDFDCMLSRASLELDALLAAAARLLKPGGVLLSMQGKLPAGACAHVRRGVVFERLRIPGLDAERHVAVYHQPGSQKAGA